MFVVESRTILMFRPNNGVCSQNMFIRLDPETNKKNT